MFVKSTQKYLKDRSVVCVARAFLTASVLMTALAMVSCGAAVGENSHGTGANLNSNDALSITAITPTTTLVGDAVNLQIKGAGFTAGSRIVVGGAPKATTFVNSSTLTTRLSASTLAEPGNFEVLVQDAQSSKQSNQLTLQVVPPLAILNSSLTSATSGTAYSATLSAIGGKTPYNWSVTSGTLPSGLSLSSTGLLAGTPSQSGTFSFTVSVTDSEATPLVANRTLSLAVAAVAPVVAPLSITTSSLVSATSGTAYSTTLAASGGTGPYKWGIASGTLPTGVTLSSAGVLAGTPSQSGTFNFTVSATDSEATPKVASSSLNLVVQAAVQPLSITVSSLPSGQVNTPYGATLAANGGMAPYTWSVYSGALPAGVSLTGTTGVISGTPSNSGTSSVVFAVQDSQGTSTKASFSITVAAAVLALQITTTALPNGIDGLPYSATISASGGTPPYTWSISSGALPSTVALAATTGEIDGTPTTIGVFTPTVQVTDSANSAVTKTLTLTVTSSTTPVMQSGSGTPSASVGNNGDLYHRTDLPQLYGPKSNGVWPATYSAILGKGCTTAYHIDWDCDGYGVGGGVYDPNPLFGPDADDNDATVNTPATALAKYGTLDGVLAAARDGHAGYTGILRYWAISPTGNDSTCTAGTSAVALANPCATYAHISPQYGTSLLQAGDAVVFRAGTYSFPTMSIGTISTPISGTATNPLLFVSYPGEAVANNINGGAGGMGFQGLGVSYATVDGLQIYDVGSATGTGYAINIGDGNALTPPYSTPITTITVRNMWIHDVADGVMMMDGLTNILVERNVSYNAIYDGHAMYLGSDYNPSTNVTVQNNLLYRTYSNPFQFNGRVTNLNFTGNILHEGAATGIALSEGVSNSFVTNNLVFDNLSGGLIFHNWSNGCSTYTSNPGPYQGQTGWVCPYDQTGNVIENNTFWQGTIAGDPADYGGSANNPIIWFVNETLYNIGQNVGNLGGNIFRNNIMVSAGGYPAINFGEGITTAEMLTSTFTNNVLIGTGSTNVVMYNTSLPPGGTTTTYTCTQAASVTTITGCINTDPLFVNVNTSYYSTPSLFDFHLQSGSPASPGAGTAAGAPSVDIQGTTQSNPPSVGAYE